LALLAISCGPSPKAAETKPPANRLTEPVAPDRYADDVGRFLAGLPARPDSQLADLHETDAWARHRRELDPAWQRLEQKDLAAMRVFQQRELASPAMAGSTIFYPFSGPDALMMTTFFPSSPVYVLVGLEPAGTLPSPKQFRRLQLASYLAKVRVTVGSELGRSFFITRQMDRQFRGQVSDGLFQPILELLVRTNRTILGYRYVRLDDRGQIVERPADFHTPGKIGNKGVEIEFRTDADGSVHKLFYFSVNLSDERLKDDPQFITFTSKLKGSTAFFKATSYMLHKPSFSTIRGLVLENCAAVLQDDSGIPYHYFVLNRWNVQLYGEYVRPIGSFRWLEQKDLREAYQAKGPKSLDFWIGYGYGKIASNLLLAIKN
jgi:hypothetical protein